MISAPHNSWKHSCGFMTDIGAIAQYILDDTPPDVIKWSQMYMWRLHNSVLASSRNIAKYIGIYITAINWPTIGTGMITCAIYIYFQLPVVFCFLSHPTNDGAWATENEFPYFGLFTQCSIHGGNLESPDIWTGSGMHRSHTLFLHNNNL